MRPALMPLLFLLAFVGCDPDAHKSETPPRFAAGERVRIAVNGQPAIVIKVRSDYSIHPYRIRYANTLGVLEYEDIEEYEILKIEP